MKKLLLSAVLLLGGISTSFGQYCTTGGPSSTGDSNLGSADLVGVSTTASYIGCPGVLGVEDQTAQVADLELGGAYSIDIDWGTCGNSYGNAGTAWIDWDGSLTFDVGEEIATWTGNGGTGIINYPFTVPAGAILGTTRMRISQFEGGSLPLDPCGSITWGSVTDFSITILCPAIIPTPTLTGDVICSGATGVLSATTPGTDVQWYDASMNPLTTGLTYTTGILAVTTYYNATTLIAGCPGESAAILDSVVVVPVNVTLTAVDETCSGTADGSFAIGTVTCGAAPFTYSVDGGAFGPAPTNLVAGTYSIIVQDNGMLQSTPIALTVGLQSTVTPNDPIVAITTIESCSGVPSIPLNAVISPLMLTYTINMFDSFGDGWNGNSIDILADGVLITTAGLGFTGGSNDTETFTVPEGTVLTTVWNSGSYIGETSYDILDENMVIIGSGASGSLVTYNIPGSAYVLSWFDMPGGTLIGTGPTFEAVGSTVMPTATVGSYDFYVTQYNGCESAPILVTVNVSDVLVTLTPQNETCSAYSNGTFSIAAVSCGTAPFMFSVDGGAFGPAPTNLTAGNYSIIVQDNGMLLSSPIALAIATTDTIIPSDPIAVDSAVYACVGDLSIMVDATSSSLMIDSLLTTMVAGNGAQGNMFSITAISDVTIDEFAMNLNAGTADVEIWFRPDDYLLVPGANTSNIGWTQVGALAGVVSLNPAYTPIAIPVGVAIPAGMTYSFHVVSATGAGVGYTNGTTVGAPFASDANIVFNEGHGGTLFSQTNVPRVFNGLITYTAGQSSSIEWFDATTAGNSVGAGAPFETVGTTILPDANTAGTYPFYAAGFGTGCYSTGRTLINVYVTPVNVELASIDADCNNAATGSFSIANVLCGTAPFMFAVDGGAFGPAPTDLMPGAYSIIVQDNNMDVSAAYTLVIGQAAAPSGLVMTTITDDGGQVSWDANGVETQWYVEWGLPGFIPGSGAEIGSAIAADTFNIITGLNGNTNYDVYVAANCGAAEVVGEWTLINFTTACGIYSTPFIETFEDNSETRVCWWNQQEVGTADWTYETGALGGTINTAFEGTKNARFVSQSGTADPVTKLVSPRFDFTGQDSVALVFAYAQENWGTQNTMNVFVNGATSPFVSLMNYTTAVNAWTVDTLFLADTTYEVAFEGTNNWGRANVIDYVQFLPCNLVAGTDGAIDACRFDTLVDLNSLITKGEDFGRWSFPINETFIENDSIANIFLLPAGVYEFLYIVETPCASDTTIAEITVFGPSSAGTDGTIQVCQNEPVDLLSGLGGNVDLGGQWYDPTNSPTPSAITASNIPGLFNYDYITSNGVCPNDTANVVVDVNSSCDYLDIQEIVFGDMEVYPNPTTGVVYISNGNAEVFSFEVTDVKGKVVASKTSAINGTETTEINLGNLEVGIYMIKVYNETASKTFRVVKQ